MKKWILAVCLLALLFVGMVPHAMACNTAFVQSFGCSTHAQAFVAPVAVQSFAVAPFAVQSHCVAPLAVQQFAVVQSPVVVQQVHAKNVRAQNVRSRSVIRSRSVSRTR